VAERDDLAEVLDRRARTEDAAGSLHEPLLTVAWPTAHLGPMGLEGAVRLGFRKELEAIAGEEEREARVRELTRAAEANARALNAASMFEVSQRRATTTSRESVANGAPAKSPRQRASAKPALASIASSSVAV